MSGALGTVVPHSRTAGCGVMEAEARCPGAEGGRAVRGEDTEDRAVPFLTCRRRTEEGGV